MRRRAYVYWRPRRFLQDVSSCSFALLDLFTSPKDSEGTIQEPRDDHLTLRWGPYILPITSFAYPVRDSINPSLIAPILQS